jgi:DNA-binding NtrC family response regulator
MKHRILAIDDEELDLEVIQDLLEENGFQVKTTTDVEEGLAYVRQNRGKLSLAIVDFKIPGTSGAEIAKRLRELDPDLAIATYSGDTSENTFETMMAAGSSYFIQKGLEPRKFLAIIKTFCNRYEETHRTVATEPVTDIDLAQLQKVGLTGVSRHLCDVANLIHVFADANETVLVRGENGTGKELIARAIHQLSKRRGRFVTINCGAIASELMESELFGHEKGSFSGAVKDKEGLIKAADNGTLFLDEIGELPLKLQVKLLRFLQEGEIQPVGNDQALSKVNVRVVAATNVNLEQAVIDGKFREDLYYRLKVLPIDLLPLRERRDDIRPLALRFFEATIKAKAVKKTILEETLKVMMRYDWPGNVRELEHEIKRIVITAGAVIRPEDLAPTIRNPNAAAVAVDSELDYVLFKQKQNEEERQYLLSKLNQTSSVRELARKVLKISNSTLQGRLRALGIVPKFEQPKEKVI